MRFSRSMFIVFLVTIFTLGGASHIAAAPFEFTVTAKTAFDKMVKGTDSATASSLTTQYAEFQSLQQEALDWDIRISALHNSNELEEKTLRKKITEIDAARIATATTEVDKAKKKHQPLFDLYETQKSQLSLAKAAKNKSLTAFFNAQVEVTKIAVSNAKKDIGTKEAALKETKSAASGKMKQIREILSAIDAAEAKIKTSKSTISSTNKRLTAETKVLNQVVKKGDAAATLSSFMRLIFYQNQILVQKININSDEQTIKGVITKASTKMKSF